MTQRLTDDEKFERLTDDEIANLRAAARDIAYDIDGSGIAWVGSPIAADDLNRLLDEIEERRRLDALRPEAYEAQEPA